MTSVAAKIICNELGNEVDISVDRERLEGVTYLTIRMEGPKSISENRITLREARELKDLLDLII